MNLRCNTVLKIVALGLCLLASACTMTAEDEALVKSVFEQVRSGRFEEFVSHLSADMRTQETRAVITKISAELIRNEEPDNISLSGWSVVTTLDGRNISAVHLYNYADRILTVSTGISQPKGETYMITNFNVDMSELTNVAPANFTLVRKSAQQLIFLGLTILSVIVMIAAFVTVLLAKNLNRKWLWAFATFAGAPSFVMNWSTGGWQAIATVGLINAGVTRGLAPLDPWILRFQLPIGAIAALIMLANRKMSRPRSNADGSLEQANHDN